MPFEGGRKWQTEHGFVLASVSLRECRSGGNLKVARLTRILLGVLEECGEGLNWKKRNWDGEKGRDLKTILEVMIDWM